MCLSVCHFVLEFFSPFGVAVASLRRGVGSSRGAFRAFVRFVLVWVCRFPLLLGFWEGLLFVIVALPGLFSYPFFGFLNETRKFVLRNLLVKGWFLGIIYVFYEGPAKSFVTGFGLLQCFVLSNIFLLQTFEVFPLY